MLHLGLLRDLQCIVDLNAKIPYCAFELGAGTMHSMIEATPSLDQLNAQQLRELVSRLMGEMRLKQAMLDKLTHEMAVLKRLKFAAKSEAFNAQQHSLLEETIDTDLEALAQEIEQLAPSASAQRKKKQPKRLPLPPELPRREIRHEPESTACRCGCQLRRIGEDVAEKLDYQARRI